MEERDEYVGMLYQGGKGHDVPIRAAAGRGDNSTGIRGDREGGG